MKKIFTMLGLFFSVLSFGQTPTTLWSYNLPDRMGRTATPAVGADGTIYIGCDLSTRTAVISPPASPASNFFAINPNGTLKWSTSIAEAPVVVPPATTTSTKPDNILSSASVHPDGSIFIGGQFSQNVFKLNPADGSRIALRRIDTRQRYNAPVFSCDGSTVYVCGYSVGDRGIRSLSADLTTQNWIFKPDTMSANGATNAASPNDFNCTPAVATDGTIYAASGNSAGNNKLFAINPNGTQKWSSSALVNFVSSAIAIGPDGTIYVSAKLNAVVSPTLPDGCLKAFNPIDGSEKWSVTFPSSNAEQGGPAIAADGTIYLGSIGGRMRAFNPANGAELWQYPLAANPAIGQIEVVPAIDNSGKIYFGTTGSTGGGMFYVLNSNGTEAYTPMSLGTSITSAATIGSDGTIYVASTDSTLPIGSGRGRLFALQTTATGLASSGWPMYAKNTKHSGLFSNTPTTVGSETVSACGSSYTWTLNGQSYTSSGTYTNVVGCNTATLALTLTPETTNITTVSSFATYTWANNGQTYTTSGIKTGTTASCVTEALDLTITTTKIPTSPLTFCKGATVASAVGATTLKFYSTLIGGTALSSTLALTTKTLYVTEMIGAAESTPRVAVSIIVNALPTQVIGTITSNTVGTTAGTFAAATVAVGPFVGTATTVSYRVPAFVGADSYFWTVPAGVRIVGQAEGVRTVTQTGTNANVLNVNYSGIAAGIGAVGSITVQAQNANGCNGTAKSVAITKALPLAPAAIVMHDLSLPNSLLTGLPVAVKSFAKYMGTTAVLTLTANPSLTATSYQWELPAGVNQLSGGTTNVITVNFAGVTSENTFNFDSTAATPVSTNVLRIGVKSVNGVGTSTTANTALVNPTTGSTAKLLTLTAVRPAAPTLKMFDMAVSPTVAVTDISRYIGTNTPLTLVGTVSATTLASSFSWELAEGVNVVAGSILSSSTIMVNFEDIAPGTTLIYVGIKAVNGMGASVKNNGSLLPATSSSASLLKLSAGLPSAAGTVLGSLAICSNQVSSVTYTITAAAAKTNLYIITAPAGTTITGGVMNTRTINAVAGATFTVNYPNGFTSVRPTQKTISIQSVNGFGVSATNKVLTLTSNTCTITSKTTAKVAPIAQDFKVNAYPNPSTGVFNLAIESSKAASTTIQVYDMQGRMIENKQVNTNAVEIGGNYTSGIYNVILENAGDTKTIRLIKK